MNNMGKKKRPLAGIRKGERRTIRRKGRKLTYEGTGGHGNQGKLKARIVSNEKA